MARPIVHICFDTETAALGERAAILSISALPFIMPSEQDDIRQNLANKADEFILNLAHHTHFFANVNATSCVMAGMDFDPATVKFWSEREPEAKMQFVTQPAVSLREAIESFIAYVADIKATFDCDVRLWCQGTDFDVPKLRYCATTLLGIPEKSLPWKYNQVCDARTYIVENLALLFGRKEGNKAIYADIPTPAEEWTKHDALSDVKRTIWNIVSVNKMLTERLKVKS